MQLRALLLLCPVWLQSSPWEAGEQELHFGCLSSGKTLIWGLLMLWTVRSEFHPRDKTIDTMNCSLTSTHLLGIRFQGCSWMWRVLLKWSGNVIWLFLWDRIYWIGIYYLLFTGYSQYYCIPAITERRCRKNRGWSVSRGSLVSSDQTMSSSAQSCKWNLWNLGVLSKGSKGEQKIWSPHLSKGSSCRQELFLLLGSLQEKRGGVMQTCGTDSLARPCQRYLDT